MTQPRWKKIGPRTLTVVALLGALLSVGGGGVQVAAEGPMCVSGAQEAEKGQINGFEVGSDASASGGSYLHMPEGTVNRWAPTAEYRAAYCFTVETGGRYRINASVWADGGTSDSFFVAVDGKMIDTGRWDVAHTNYGRDRVNSYRAANPAEFDLTAGDHIVEVYLREDGTRLDTLALDPVAGDPSCTGGWVDAESGQLDGFVAIRSQGAHANKAIWVPEGTGSQWFPSAGHRAQFCFTVQQDGIYRLEADVLADSANSDSFFVSIDNGTPFTWYLPTTSDWVTDLANEHGVADPAEFTLTAGNHTVDIFAREDGAMLDRVRLVERPNAPQRSCGLPRAEAEDGALTGFSVGSADAASGGEFIHVPDGDGSSWFPSDATMATYCLTVDQPGSYQIVAGAWAEGNNSDSFWVRVGTGDARRWNVTQNKTFITDVMGLNDKDPYVVELERGNHVVDVLLREDGTRLDWISLEAVTP